VVAVDLGNPGGKKRATRNRGIKTSIQGYFQTMTALGTIYLFLQFVRFIGFVGLGGLMMRDFLKGKNGFTPGLFVFSLGNVVNSSYSVMDTLTITTASPGGIIPMEISLGAYDLLRVSILTAGAFLIVAGMIMTMLVAIRGNDHAHG
jgi:hypothetical protein